MADPLPSEHRSTLGRDMPCPVCGDAWHSPYVCNSRDGIVRSRSALEDEESDVDYDPTRDPCPCRFVPIPGAL
jgi:hypothetical protein